MNTTVSDLGLLTPKIPFGIPMIKKFSPSFPRMSNWVISPSLASSVMLEKILSFCSNDAFARMERSASMEFRFAHLPMSKRENHKLGTTNFPSATASILAWVPKKVFRLPMLMSSEVVRIRPRTPFNRSEIKHIHHILPFNVLPVIWINRKDFYVISNQNRIFFKIAD